MKYLINTIFATILAMVLFVSCNNEESETISDEENTVESVPGFTFSGYKWNIKETKNIADSRYFCLTNKNNVSIQKDGSLDIKLTKIENLWYGGELTIDSTFGYGEFSFEISSPNGSINPNSTLSITILNVTDDYYEGMTQTGVRFSKYSEPNSKNELEYFLYATDKKIAEVQTPENSFLLSSKKSIHKIGIYPNYLIYSSSDGDKFNETKMIKQTGSSTIGLADELTFSPSTDKLKVIISFCLAESNEPVGNTGLTVKINKFKFTPEVANITKQVN